MKSSGGTVARRFLIRAFFPKSAARKDHLTRTRGCERMRGGTGPKSEEEAATITHECAGTPRLRRGGVGPVPQEKHSLGVNVTLPNRPFTLEGGRGRSGGLTLGGKYSTAPRVALTRASQPPSRRRRGSNLGRRGQLFAATGARTAKPDEVRRKSR